MNRIHWVVVITMVALLAPGAVEALADTPPLNYEVTLQHMEDSPAALRIQAVVDLQKVEIKLTKGRNKAVVHQIPSLKKGESKTFEWEEKVGLHDFTMEISAVNAEGTWAGSTTFRIETLAALLLDVDLAGIDLSQGVVPFATSRPAVRAELELYGDGKQLIEQVEVTYGGTSRKEKIAWKNVDVLPVLMRLKVYDALGAWRLTEVFRLEIPHTDIVFDTAAASIRDDQVPHLEETLAPIREALRTFDDISIELYIAGYTDTVGSKQANLELSERRAKAIAQWFRQNGIKIPVYYQGFGESVLAVPTPDETPHEQNRRAVYVLSNAKPQSPDFPTSNWKRIP